MREVDFKYLRAALESLSSSTDLVLMRGCIMAVLSSQASPYVSHRRVHFEMVHQPLEGDVLLAANYRKILLVGMSAGAVEHAAETVGRAGRPFEDSQIGWDGPRAKWVVELVPSTLNQLYGLLKCAHDYGLVGSGWLESPLLHVAWLVPVVMGWDENGRPVFDWPDRPAESEPVDQDLPVEV